MSGLGIWDLEGLGTYRFGIKLIFSVVSGFWGFWALWVWRFEGLLGLGFGTCRVWDLGIWE
jgi:hypothetical protein